MCARCKQDLPVSHFGYDRSRSDGLFSYCRECAYKNTRKYIKKKERYYKEYHRQYRIANRHRRKYVPYAEMTEQQKEDRRNRTRIRRARKRNQSHTVPTICELNERMSKCGLKCVYCDKPYTAIDHVHPIALGGGDDLYNLVPSCKSCNSSKNCKPWKKWFRHQPFYSLKRETLIENLTKPSL